MKTIVSLLYLEDDELDRDGFLRMVQQKNLPYDVTIVETLAKARMLLSETRFDIIVADYHLPDGDCSELFAELSDTPFIVITGTLEESLALRTLERGADDYLPKSSEQHHLDALPFAIEKTLKRQQVRERERRLTRELLDSEERFRLLVESVKEYAIFMLDRDGLVTTWNVGAERIKGWTAREILGRNYSVFFLPEDVAAEKPQRELQIAAREGHFQEQARRLRKDGSTFWADVTLSAIKDEHDELIGFGKVTHDISERRRAEEALRESEANLQLALNAAHFGMWKWDLISDEMTWSDQCKELFGLSPETSITYTRFLQTVHPEDRERVDEALGQAIELRTAYNVELRAVWPDGSMHWIGAIGRGYYSRTGKALRVAGVVFDLAAVKKQPVEATL